MSIPEDLLDNLEEVRENEWPEYFSERGGRLYHALTIASPYPFPVDTPENERLTLLHRAVAELMGANYFGPVAEVLSPQLGQKRVVVDLACGRGQWAMEMAREFPHATFHGLDVVPIATREPEENVYFVIHDIGEQTMFANASVDLLHARSVFLTVRDYNVIIQEAARILKPGGLFLSGEWGLLPAFTPGAPEAENENLGIHVPGLDRFYRALRTACRDKLGITTDGIFSFNPLYSRIPEWLESSGAFQVIIAHHMYIPIGDWSPDPTYKALGSSNRAAMAKLIESSKELLLSSGMTKTEFEHMFNQVTVEMHGIPGLVSIYYMVEARRK